MANDVKKRFSSFLPGAGFDSAGGPKQGKTRVVGIVDVTSYSSGEGEPFTAVDVGLTTIDAISLRVREELDGDILEGNIRSVVYALGTGHFYLYTTAQLTGVITPYAAAATETLEFVAEGDSAADVELT